jgi:8-oxo-dGTP pyrophosphatase MutT (NUDIX family)
MLKGKASCDRPYLIVQALIRKNTGDYLAIKRAGSIEIGSWEFPGGKVKPGETIEKALLREVMEETNLKVDIERFIGWGQGLGIRHENGGLYDRFVMFFECRLIKGSFRTNSESSDFRWAPLGEIMELRPLSQPVRNFFSKFRRVPLDKLPNGMIAGSP